MDFDVTPNNRISTPIIYLASPYTHPDMDVRVERYEEILRIAGNIMATGRVVYSPIAHSHPISEKVQLPETWEYWESQCMPMLSVCSELWVADIDGWKESCGVQAEIAWFEKNRNMIWQFVPEEFYK